MLGCVCIYVCSYFYMICILYIFYSFPYKPRICFLIMFLIYCFMYFLPSHNMVLITHSTLQTNAFCIPLIYCMIFYIQFQSLIIMVVKYNQFIDDDNLTDKSSLIHLLDRHDADDCDEIPLLKHSPFYSENQFTSLKNKQWSMHLGYEYCKCLH